MPFLNQKGRFPQIETVFVFSLSPALQICFQLFFEAILGQSDISVSADHDNTVYMYIDKAVYLD